MNCRASSGSIERGIGREREEGAKERELVKKGEKEEEKEKECKGEEKWRRRKSTK